MDGPDAHGAKETHNATVTGSPVRRRRSLLTDGHTCEVGVVGIVPASEVSRLIHYGTLFSSPPSVYVGGTVILSVVVTQSRGAQSRKDNRESGRSTVSLYRASEIFREGTS